MSCVPLPNANVSLPVGVSLEPPAVGVAGDLEANLCCHLSLPFALQVQLPGLSLSADLLLPIQIVILLIEAELDQLPLDCPFD